MKLIIFIFPWYISSYLLKPCKDIRNTAVLEQHLLICISHAVHEIIKKILSNIHWTFAEMTPLHNGKVKKKKDRKTLIMKTVSQSVIGMVMHGT